MSTPSGHSPAPSSSPSAAGCPIRTLVYIGTPDNDQFIGPQEPQALAEHIFRSEGPSGLNRDYLWNLEQSLDELSPSSGDEHVTDLSDRVRAIAAAARHSGDEEILVPEPETQELGLDKWQTDDKILRSPLPVTVSPPGAQELRVQQQQQHHEFRKASSVDEQEETEKTS